MALNFTDFSEQFDEAFKDFPKDRVNRQIEKHKKDRDDYRGKADHFGKKSPNARSLAQEKAHKSETKRHSMTGVKNHLTKMTDAHKAKQKFVGSDRQKAQERVYKHENDSIEASDTKGNRKSAKRQNTLSNVANSNIRSRRYDASNDEKHAAKNREDKEAKRKAKSSMTRTNLEKLYKSEALNFTEFLEATDGLEPIYHVEGKLPKCPRGHVFDRETKRCVPKSERDSVSTNSGKDASPENGPQFNVIGKTGVNGDGYAYAEPNNWGSD